MPWQVDRTPLVTKDPARKRSEVRSGQVEGTARTEQPLHRPESDVRRSQVLDHLRHHDHVIGRILRCQLFEGFSVDAKALLLQAVCRRLRDVLALRVPSVG
jgi:hypothetical protein